MRRYCYNKLSSRYQPTEYNYKETFSRLFRAVFQNLNKPDCIHEILLRIDFGIEIPSLEIVVILLEV